MRDVVVQETPEFTKRTEGMFGSFQSRRRRMLLRWGTLWRRCRNGSVWQNGRAGEEMNGSTAGIEAEFGGHGGVL
jgi:hypothetical protein